MIKQKVKIIKVSGEIKVVKLYGNKIKLRCIVYMNIRSLESNS